MKKKLVMLLSLAMTMSLLGGCVVAPSSSNAPYQLKVVSEYQFDLAGDAYAEDELSNTSMAVDMAVAQSLEENDPRLANTYTYEQLAACFAVAAELSPSNMAEYLSVELTTEDDEMNQVFMRVKNGYYVAGRVRFINSDSYGIEMEYEFDPFTFDGYIISCEKNDKRWTMDWFASAALKEASSVYTFTPASEMWTTYNDVQAIYVATRSEDGKTLLVEEYKNNPIEITYMLRMISEKGLLNGGGTSTNPEETPAPDSGTTPEGGSSEQTPPPAPTPTPSNGFEGIYWVTNMAYGEEGQRKGIYLDGNGKYVALNEDGTITEWEYANLEITPTSNGTKYLFFIYKNGESFGALEFVRGNDGNLYYEWGDGGEGGLDLYVPVSAAEFYGN